MPLSWLKRLLSAGVLGVIITVAIAASVALRDSPQWPFESRTWSPPFEAEVGWPSPAFRYAQQPGSMNSAGVITAPTQTPAFTLTTTAGGFYVFPVIPAWPGLAIDLVVWTAAAGAATLVFDLVRFRLLRRTRRRRSLAREWCAHAVVGFLLGLLITLGVAWWLTVNRMPAAPCAAEVIGVAHDPATGNAFMLQQSTGFGWRFMEGMNAEGRAPANATAVPRPWSMPRDLRRDEHWVEVRVGWPFRAVRSGFRGTWPPREGERASWLPFMQLSTAAGEHLLPIVPMWSGLVTSAAIYGGGYAAVAGALCALERRRREGKCPNCMYSLRGLPDAAACPECGASRNETS